MKINLFVQPFYLLKTSGIARVLFLCLLMRSSLFSTYRLDIKETKEGRRGELARCSRKLPLLPSASASLPGIREFIFFSWFVFSFRLIWLMFTIEKQWNYKEFYFFIFGIFLAKKNINTINYWFSISYAMRNSVFRNAKLKFIRKSILVNVLSIW